MKKNILMTVAVAAVFFVYNICNSNQRSNKVDKGKIIKIGDSKEVIKDYRRP